MVAKWSSSSTRSAASRATSVPERPIAMPMSACRSAGPVVHPVAGHRHDVTRAPAGARSAACPPASPGRPRRRRGPATPELGVVGRQVGAGQTDECSPSRPTSRAMARAVPGGHRSPSRADAGVPAARDGLRDAGARRVLQRDQAEQLEVPLDLVRGRRPAHRARRAGRRRAPAARARPVRPQTAASARCRDRGSGQHRVRRALDVQVPSGRPPTSGAARDRTGTGASSADGSPRGRQAGAGGEHVEGDLHRVAVGPQRPSCDRAAAGAHRTAVAASRVDRTRRPGRSGAGRVVAGALHRRRFRPVSTPRRRSSRCGSACRSCRCR